MEPLVIEHPYWALVIGFLIYFVVLWAMMKSVTRACNAELQQLVKNDWLPELEARLKKARQQ